MKGREATIIASQKALLKKLQEILQNPLTNPKECDIIIGLSKNGRYESERA